MNIKGLKAKVFLSLKPPLAPFIGVGIISGVIVGFLTNIKPQHDNAPVVAEKVINRLNELQNHLVSLESSAKKSLPDLDLSVVEEKLKTLSRDVAEIRQFNPDELNSRIEHRLTKTEETLSHQLNTLNSTVNDLQSANQPVKYLPFEALPFSVTSIDSIQNTPVASIQYDYKTFPVEKGDLLAGWRVVLVDFRHQAIEFENKQKERVRVQQANIG